MEIKTKNILKRIGDLEREIEYIKRDLMHLRLAEKPKQKTSLFGSVRGGDITEEIQLIKKRTGFEIISFTSDILEEVTRVDIPEIHDRIIVATARFYRAGILTKDRIIFEREIKP